MDFIQDEEVKAGTVPILGSSAIRGKRHKPRQLEGNIQAVFAQVLSGEIGPKWIH